MIRCFVAISVPAPVARGMSETVLHLKELGIDARFPSTDSIHLTLKFLGQTDESLVGRIGEVLENCALSVAPFALHVEGLGVFPSLRKPRVVWVGIRTEPMLQELQTSLEAGLLPLGFEPERRSFQPHLTLARMKSSRNRSGLQYFVEKNGSNLSLGSLRVDAIHLYQSLLRPSGAEYRKLSTHGLVGNARMLDSLK